jgi:hypothetical protein
VSAAFDRIPELLNDNGAALEQHPAFRALRRFIVLFSYMVVEKSFVHNFCNPTQQQLQQQQNDISVIQVVNAAVICPEIPSWTAIVDAHHLPSSLNCLAPIPESIHLQTLFKECTTEAMHV